MQNDGGITEMEGRTLTERREKREELFHMYGENYRVGGDRANNDRLMST